MTDPAASANPGRRGRPSDTDWDAIWERDAGNFLAEGPSTRTRVRLSLRLLRTHAKEGGTLLDVGCGSGLLMSRAAALRHYAKVVGVDVARATLDRARASYPGFSFHELDIQRERLPESFDTIISLATIDIIEDDRAAIRNMAAMLVPGGRLIISAQYGPSSWSRLDTLRAWRRYDLKGVEDLGSAAGLDLIRCFTWGWPLYSAYYKILERRPEGTGQESAKGWHERLASRMLYLVFFLDDFFTWSGKGRQLFAVFEKP